VEALLVANKKVGLEVILEKAKCIFMFREYNRGQNYNMKIANKSTESVVKFKVCGNDGYKSKLLTLQNVRAADYLHEPSATICSRIFRPVWYHEI